MPVDWSEFEPETKTPAAIDWSEFQPEQAPAPAVDTAPAAPEPVAPARPLPAPTGPYIRGLGFSRGSPRVPRPPEGTLEPVSFLDRLTSTPLEDPDARERRQPTAVETIKGAAFPLMSAGTGPLSLAAGMMLIPDFVRSLPQMPAEAAELVKAIEDKDWNKARKIATEQGLNLALMVAMHKLGATKPPEVPPNIPPAEVTGASLNTPPGAPAPRPLPPEETGRATPEEAAAQAKAMQAEATTTFQPARPPRPTVPETPAEPERALTVVDEIRKANAKSKSEIQALFPDRQLTREEAGELRKAAWGVDPGEVRSSIANVQAMLEKPVEGPRIEIPESVRQLLPRASAQAERSISQPVENVPQETSTGTTDALKSVYEDNVLKLRSASPEERPAILQEMSRQAYDELAKDPSFEPGGAIQVELSHVFQNAFETGKIDETAVRSLLKQTSSTAPSRLPQSSPSSLALQKAPSGVAPKPAEVRAIEKGSEYASSQPETATLHGDVRPLKEPAAVVPAEEGQPGIQPAKPEGPEGQAGVLSLADQLRAQGHDVKEFDAAGKPALMITPREGPAKGASFSIFADATPEQAAEKIKAKEAEFSHPKPTPETPPQAAARVEDQVKTVAATEGVRSAKEVKAELLSRIDKAMETAPEKLLYDAKKHGVVEINIPGDGDFKVPNNLDALGSMRQRVNRISVSPGGPIAKYPSGGAGDIADQARKASDAYGSPEAAYRSVKRQLEALQSREPQTREENKTQGEQIQGAEHLLRELYGNTKAGELEAKAEKARESAQTYKTGAEGFEKEIARVEAIKRKFQAHKDRLADLKERYAQNQDFIKTNERNAEQWEQQAAKEKAALEAGSPPEKGPGMVGLGGALEGEVDTGHGADIYGIAERVRAERARAGQVEEVPPGKGISAPDSVDHGRQLIASGVDPEKVLSDFEKTKKLSADDMAVVRAHGEALAAAARRVEGKFGTTSQEYLTAWKALSEWDRRTKAMQTEWHKTGQAQQGETDIDTGTFTGLQRAFREETGTDFTPHQAKRAKEIADGVKKAKEAKEDAQKKLLNTVDNETLDPHVKSLADRIIAALDQKAANALKRIKQRRAEGRLFTGIDPTDLADYAIYGASKMAKGAITFSRWSAEMIKDLGQAIEPHLKQIWEAADKALDSEVAGQPESVKRAVKKTPMAPADVKKALEGWKPGTKMSIEQARAMWQLARIYIDQGITDFDEIRTRLATDTGLPVDDVTKGLAQPKGAKQMTDDLWRKKQTERRTIEQAKRWVKSANTPGYTRAIQAVPRVLFSLKVGFHGTVALGTHAPMVAFQPLFWATYVRDFVKMYRMVGNPAYYEQQVQDLIRRPDYITARRAGLVNDPFTYEEYQTPAIKEFVAKVLGPMADKLDKVTTMGNRGYAVLKILRQDMFDQHWNQLPASARTPEVAAAIADGLNHATGVTQKMAPTGSSLAFFAPRLEASRVAWLAVDPVRAANTFLNWSNATEAEKMFASNQLKEKAWVAGTLFSLLALNAGILRATDSKQEINFDDPFKGDFLKFKLAGMQASYGNAMVSMARLPLRLWVGIKNEGKLNKIIYEDENTAKIMFDYARSQASPFAGLGLDLAFGRDFQGRPIPRAGFGFLPGRKNLPKRLRERGIKPYTWPEYWSQTLSPIPVSEGLKEVWETGLGMTPKQEGQVAKGLFTISFMAATGARLGEDYNQKK